MSPMLADPADMQQALRALQEAAVEAGRMALPYFNPGERTHARIRAKEGGSPVTEADHLVDQLLARRLQPLFPHAAWLSEESLDDPVRLDHRWVLIIDPIDGTRGFIAGDPRWTICIALTYDGRPVAGVVHAPALAETFAATAGGGAFRNGDAVQASQRSDLDGARIAGPKALIDALQEDGVTLQREPYIPSLAYRLVAVAAGSIDAGIASINSHDWDLAAVDLIVHEAGGRLTGLAGEKLIYNRPLPRHGMLVAAGAALYPRILAATRALQRRKDRSP
jgi:myo-inositol-1(or 4)-monophosphatase